MFACELTCVCGEVEAALYEIDDEDGELLVWRSFFHIGDSREMEVNGAEEMDASSCSRESWVEEFEVEG